jgi:hypothetical protein
MTYTQQTWADNNPTYPASAARFAHIEQGVYDANQGVNLLTASTTVAGSAAGNATALAADIATASTTGQTIYLPEGDHPINNVNVVDKHLRITGPGRLVQQQANEIFNIRNTIGAARSVTSIATLEARNVDYTTDFEFFSSLALAQADIADVVQGDLFLIVSNDPYTGQYVPGGGSTYPCQWVPAAGLGMDVTISGTIIEGNTIVGATSAATAQVLGVWTQATTSQKTLVLGARTGTFQAAEQLNIQGGAANQATVGAVPTLLMAGRLLDTHTTSISLYKLPARYDVNIDVRIACSGDTDSVVTSANRGEAAIELINVAHPRVKVDAEGTWARVLRFQSCYMPVGEVRVNKAPNAATASEAGFGYGIEAIGATEHGMFRVIARNVRHAFTTNCNNAANFAAVDPKRSGVPKWNTVHDSIGVNCVNAAFDTHAGAVYTRFENCHAYNNNTGGRTVTTAAGFQNRAFGTEMMNCVDHGSLFGFSDVTNQYAAPFANTVRYINCHADRFQHIGFDLPLVTGSKADALTDFEFRGCFANADMRISDTTNSYQVCYRNVSSKASYEHCKAADMNGAPWRFIETAGDNTILNCYTDYTRGPASSTGIRFEANATLKLFGYRWAKAAAAPSGAVRVPTGITATNVRTDGATCINASSQVFADVQGTFSAVYSFASGQELVGAATWTPGTVTDGTTVTTSVTVTGAVIGDAVTFVSFDKSGQAAGAILTGVVTATNTVGVSLRNQSGGSLTLTTSGTVRVIVRKAL